MAQHDYNIANASFPTVRTDLNNVLSAINSSNSGSSRPSSAVAGTIWLDTSGAATAQLLKLYDGADDITLATVNFTANTVDFQDSDTGGITFKQEGTNFTDSLLVGHATHGTLSSANDNTGVGIDALDALTSGSYNTAVGSGSLSVTQDGNYNTMLGYDSGRLITTSANNAGVGARVLNKQVGGGGRNAAIGMHSLYETTGGYNCAIGYASGQNISSGQYNIVMGYESGDNITSGDGNVIIGGINADSATGDKQLIIADGVNGSVAWIKGDSSGTVSANGGHLTTTGKALVMGF